MLPALDVRLALRQVERGVDLADAAFAIDVPAGAVPITIEELRESGPLRETRRDSDNRDGAKARRRDSITGLALIARSRHRAFVIVAAR